jgi:hypothetical protein
MYIKVAKRMARRFLIGCGRVMRDSRNLDPSRLAKTQFKPIMIRRDE